MRVVSIAAAAALVAIAPAEGATYTGILPQFGGFVDLDFDGATGPGRYTIRYQLSGPASDLEIGGYVEEVYNYYDENGDYEGGNEVPVFTPEFRSNTTAGIVSFTVAEPYVVPSGFGTRRGFYQLKYAYAATGGDDSLPPVRYRITTSFAAGIPEPASWALMILGFGAVGGAMRRRQSVAAKVRFA